MAKPNYRFMKKQKESARIARQQEKLTRKLARAAETLPDGTAAPADPAPTVTPAADVETPATPDRNESR